MYGRRGPTGVRGSKASRGDEPVGRNVLLATVRALGGLRGVEVPASLAGEELRSGAEVSMLRSRRRNLRLTIGSFRGASLTRCLEDLDIIDISGIAPFLFSGTMRPLACGP